MSEGSRLVWWRGLLALAVRRVASPKGGESRQIGLHVAGVALPVALMLVVTGVSLGLATGTTVQSPDVDYWIVPETGTARSAVVSVGGPQFGQVHPVSERLTARDDVEYATPVLMELVRMEADGTTEFVLVIGAIPRAESDRFIGVSTAALSPGDPHYANGSYDGRWTGEAVLSAAAADLLDAEQGTTLRPGGSAGDRTFSVVGVSRGDDALADQFPVVLVHLSELQTIAGAASGDQADQILVKTTRTGVKDDLEGVYPKSLVLSGSGLTSRQASTSSLPLALALTALAVAVAVGLLFAASTMGLAIASESRERAVLAALGFSGRSRAALIATQALVVTLLGGAVGVALGAAGIVLTNELVTRYVVDIPVARFHPLLVAYGLGVALLIGLLIVPYLLFMSRRTTTIGALRE